jgi:dTDP-4-dehydrorhamnose 3,5-epimerase
MHIESCPIEGLKIIHLTVHGDARGFFVERYHKDKLAALGFDQEFIQDNHSRSAPGILRGLHWQSHPQQSKLVGVIRGRVWDVAVDIRPDSPTFGQHHAVELNGENGLLFWIPSGFAHGFCVLGEEPADMIYKVSGAYNPQSEGGIRFDDPQLAIPWPIENPLTSPRDQNLMSFAQYCAAPVRW